MQRDAFKSQDLSTNISCHCAHSTEKAHFIQNSRYIEQIMSFQVAETSAQLRRKNSFFRAVPAILGDNT